MIVPSSDSPVSVTSKCYEEGSPQAHWDATERLIQAIYKVIAEQKKKVALEFDVDTRSIILRGTKNVSADAFQKRLSQVARQPSVTVIKSRTQNLKVMIRSVVESTSSSNSLSLKALLPLHREISIIGAFEEMVRIKGTEKDCKTRLLTKRLKCIRETSSKERGKKNRQYHSEIDRLTKDSESRSKEISDQIEKLHSQYSDFEDDYLDEDLIKLQELEEQYSQLALHLKEQMKEKAIALSSVIHGVLKQTAEQYGFVGAASGISIEEFLKSAVQTK